MRVSADPADVESVTIRYLTYVLLPAWFVPGIAGYVIHRRTRIERTSGLSESAIHALMMAEISVPLLLTLLCEVNPLLLGISAAAAGAHEATAIWDVRSAVDGGREVRPALTDYHARDRYGFTPPGHRQGRGADPRTRAAIGEDAFRSDLLSTAGLDDRRSSHGYLSRPNS